MARVLASGRTSATSAPVAGAAATRWAHSNRRSRRPGGRCPRRLEAGVVAVDGKTLRRFFDRAASASPLHLVSAWAVEQRLVLGQLAVDGKSNEITAAPQLLALLALKDTVVTADALNCRRASTPSPGRWSIGAATTCSP